MLPSARSPRPLLVAVALALALTSAAPAEAELTHKVALLGGGELWLTPETGGHGFALAAYDLGGLPHGSQFGAEINTETLRLRYHHLNFFDGMLELGFFGAFEIYFSGLLPDYYRLGARDPARGFSASYGQLQMSAKVNLPGRHTIEALLGVRKWFFTGIGDTDPALTLPPEAWVFEPRLRYTLWRVEQDAAFSERHRMFPRVRGLAFGLEVAVDVRTETAPWGARAGAFSPRDTRNDPDRTSVLVQQWLLAGIQLHERVRTQVRESTGWGSGTDDLNRVRLGGMNPYVVPLAGAPWAAFLSDGYLAGQWSWHVKVAGESEVGALVDVVWLEDEARTGSSAGGTQVGVGLFGDLRFGAFQVDLRLGWCPTLDWQGDGGQLAAFAALGWLWS